ncbi:hypothetical protein V2G26_006156 [Clonostachys chloroleuca]
MSATKCNFLSVSPPVLSQFESAKSSPKIFGVPDVTFAHPGIFKPAVGPGVSKNGLIYNARPLKVSQYPSLSRTQWPVRSFQNLNSALEYQNDSSAEPRPLPACR